MFVLFASFHSWKLDKFERILGLERLGTPTIFTLFGSVPRVGNIHLVVNISAIHHSSLVTMLEFLSSADE